MDKDENGYILAETIGAFIPFLLLVVSILSLVNIVVVQARVHYALTQTANTMAMYSYTLEVMGVANSLTTLDNKANKVAQEVRDMKADIKAVVTGLESFSELREVEEKGKAAIERGFSWAEMFVSDPKNVLQLLMNYTVNELRNQAFEMLVRPMVGRYLANGSFSGDEYLCLAGVINRDLSEEGLSTLNFYDSDRAGLGNSCLIDKDGNIRLVVTYEIEYTFGGLHLPFRPTIRITQEVITKAWLNGSGKGYW